MKIYGSSPYQNEKASLVSLLYVVYALQRVQNDFDKLESEADCYRILYADLKLLLLIAAKYKSDINLKLKKDRVNFWNDFFISWSAKNNIAEVDRIEITGYINELKNYGYPQKWLDENFMKSNINHETPSDNDKKDLDNALNFVTETYFKFIISEIEKSILSLDSNELCQTLVTNLDILYTLASNFPSQLRKVIMEEVFLSWESSFKDWHKRVYGKLPIEYRDDILINADNLLKKNKRIILKVVSMVSPSLFGAQPYILGRETHYSYNDYGDIIQVETADGRVFEYGLLTTIKNPEGECWEYRYGNRNELRFVTAPDGLKWEYRYNDRYQVVRYQYPDGNYRGYHYNERNQLISVRDSRGGQTGYQRDMFNRITILTQADGSQYRYEYSEAHANPKGSLA